MSGVARGNPNAVPYPPDAYADSDERRPRRRHRRRRRRPDDDGGTSPFVWIAGLAAIALLVAIAFLVFQLAGGGGGRDEPSASPSASAVTVPNFVGMTVDRRPASRRRPRASPSSRPASASDQPVGTILTQDPPAGTIARPPATP